MKHAVLVLVVFLLHLPAWAAAKPRLFVVGDSISMHYGSYLEAFVSGSFEYDRKRDAAGGAKAAHNLDVPQGANGGDSAMVLAYLKTRAERAPLQADVLLLNCGLHDIKTDLTTQAKQVAPDAYARNLRAILDVAKQMKLQVVWVRTTPVVTEIHNARSRAFHRFAADVAAYNAIADEIMGEAGVPIIDLHGFSARFVPAGFVDHVHFSEDVREKQAAFIAGALKMLRKTSDSR
jgi:lysophospholipase L1-like esterase